MITKFFTSEYWIEFAVGLVLAVVIIVASRNFNPKDKHRSMKAGFLQIPTYHTLISLGFIVPALIAIIAYLYTKNPSGNYSTLYASITFYFLSLLVAIWHNFALLSKATPDEVISLNMPKDRPFITALGLIYLFLILGVLYFGIFFLFFYKPVDSKLTTHVVKTGYRYLSKPALQIKNTKQDVKKLWGEPMSKNGSNTWVYQSVETSITLIFDEKDNLQTITEERK